MTNKEKSAKVVSEIVDIFRCPICHRSMKVVDFKSLICSNNHTFDFAKQGYVNMLTRPSNQHYDKNLFEARQKIIMESNLYSSLHKKVSEIIGKHLDEFHYPTIIFDAGSGEGSHLQKIINECRDRAITGIGLDIAKEGIIMASKNYHNPIWLVGDLANIPLTDQSSHVVLNILSPANYMEFKRVLAPEGIIVKIVPRPNYLKELREVIFTNSDKKAYTNGETISLFKQNFQLVNNFRFSYFKELEQTELLNLIQMSPLAWNAEKEQIDSFLKLDSTGITVDLDILIGVKSTS
ncbi:putative RNA methyltransferase [Pseudogracilibacillus sp. SO10305]|uniref:putative RNA methyltransferase n=1 Tax=Pseudogracilibacillus sp. SO10305 TaxID=3098292 RepID=UPI00300E016C